jgi:dCMP deaminase
MIPGFRLRQAYHVSLLSQDPSTQCGALLLTKTDIITGHNRLPLFIKENIAGMSRADKLDHVIHDAIDCICTAARQGISTEGATLVSPWSVCRECAKIIIEAGITRIIGHKQAYEKTPDRWRANMDFARKLLDGAGVSIELYDGQLFEPPFRVLMNREYWCP